MTHPPTDLSRLRDALRDRYTLEEVVGQGGMATVYRARDVSHDRLVAIKVLRAELAASLGRERFLREITFAAQLQHPHVLPLFDSGQAGGHLYYVMPFVDGESLEQRLDREGPLEVEVALGWLREIGDGLDHAHRHGIVHRDVKPGNIMLRDGHAIVTDFGIAKAILAAGSDPLTSAGLVVGTPAYMSPEQASGGAVDSRSDVYSLACLAYRMLAGAPPFTGPTPNAILARHATDPVPPLSTVRPTLSSAIDAVLQRALAKVPADRYATANAFTAALTEAVTGRLGSHPSTHRRRTLVGALIVVVVVAAVAFWRLAGPSDDRTITRVAVLPPLDPPDAQRPVVMGMYNMLLAELGRSGVPVVGGVGTMLRFAGRGSSVREIAEALDADAIIEPALIWAGDSVSIVIRLIDGVSERALWSNHFEAGAADVQALYRNVTLQIANEVRTAITPPAAMLTRIIDPEAQRDYFRGLSYAASLTPEDLTASERYFQRALDRAPDFAAAHAGLSRVWIAKQQLGLALRPEATPIAVREARQALALDSTLPEAHHARGLAEGWSEWNWALAESEMRRAIDLNPRYGGARADLALLMAVLHRWDEGMAQADSAVLIDPYHTRFRTFRAGVLVGVGRLDTALSALSDVVREEPNSVVAWNLIQVVYRLQGMLDSAVAAQARSFEALGATELATTLRRDYAAQGYPRAMSALAERLAALAGSGTVSPVQVAAAYNAAGNPDQAIAWLRRGREARDPDLPYFVAFPALFRGLDLDPRLREIQRSLRFPWALEEDTLRSSGRG